MCKTVVSDYAPLQVWLGCGVQIIFVQREAVAGGQQNEAVDVVELSRANWLAERCVTTLHGSVYTDVLSNTAQRREGSTGYAEQNATYLLHLRVYEKYEHSCHQGPSKAVYILMFYQKLCIGLQ